MNIKPRIDEVKFVKHETKVFFSESNPSLKEKMFSVPDYFIYRKKCQRNGRKLTILDYLQHHMFPMSEEERNKYLFRCDGHEYEHRLNGGIVDDFRDKKTFLKIFKDYVHRDWISSDECSYDKFKSFCEKNKTIIIKPLNATCGVGIHKENIDENTDIKSLYDAFLKEDGIAEECITACKEISEFHPASLNTIRYVTYRNGEYYKVLYTAFRMGNSGATVDNVHAGGISALIDPESGVITTDGFRIYNNHYDTHPYSNKKIEGTQIPHWERVKEYCKELSTVYPKAKVVGWDIGVLENGEPEIIEGNDAPDFDFVQRGKPLSEDIQKILKNA